MAGKVARGLMAKRARMQNLVEGIQQLETRLERAQPITVLRVRDCDHPECGELMPAEVPPDCLILQLGCMHAIPNAEPPEGAEVVSRIERAAERGVGQGLGPEGVRQAIKSIRLLNR